MTNEVEKIISDMISVRCPTPYISSFPPEVFPEDFVEKKSLYTECGMLFYEKNLSKPYTGVVWYQNETNGQITKATYKDGKQDGLVETCDINGKLKFREINKNELLSIWEEYDESGKVINRIQ